MVQFYGRLFYDMKISRLLEFVIQLNLEFQVAPKKLEVKGLSPSKLQARIWQSGLPRSAALKCSYPAIKRPGMFVAQDVVRGQIGGIDRKFRR
jgi:hypothetical protein